MWDTRKLLLAIIFTAVNYKVTAENAQLLDRNFVDVVDDLYTGCREEAMKKFIHSNLLGQELNRSKEFQHAWSGNTQCSTLIPNGIKEHTAALSVFNNEDSVFITTFGEAVERKGVNVSVYEEDFHFKSLHFLLMDSMKLLKPKECKTLFLLQEKQKIPQAGSTVRLGHFTTVNSNYDALKQMEDFDGQVLFNITSCFFVKLGDHACNKDTNSALLSPAEFFTVEEIIEKENDDIEYTEVILKHSELRSSHNCYMFSRSPMVVSTQWLVSVLVALSFFL
ncbi:ecto-ADP-ribosyltransferase 5-like [Embiotoca jacksoni]|uniref:ecto-ADP-ribosyltransferase 5-like n=1 Tax=Embiotoca jacksoni TaxID=100190 RepID=UPI003703E4A1